MRPSGVELYPQDAIREGFTPMTPTVFSVHSAVMHLIANKSRYDNVHSATERCLFLKLSTNFENDCRMGSAG